MLRKQHISGYGGAMQAHPGSRPPDDGLAYVGMRSPKRIGRSLRDARRAAGLTQSEVAAAAGVSREAISVLENGHRSARLETLNAVLFELGFELAFVRRAQSPTDAPEGKGNA